MPKIVNWDAKRDEILSATWRVIARDGLARATITAIAREASRTTSTTRPTSSARR
jgi:AcrR family transcriptional regulator